MKNCKSLLVALFIPVTVGCEFTPHQQDIINARVRDKGLVVAFIETGVDKHLSAQEAMAAQQIRLRRDTNTLSQNGMEMVKEIKKTPANEYAGTAAYTTYLAKWLDTTLDTRTIDQFRYDEIKNIKAGQFGIEVEIDDRGTLINMRILPIPDAPPPAWLLQPSDRHQPAP